MASTIYLVRHGECKANLEQMTLPPDIDVITERGRLQASLLGKWFQEKNIVFDKAYCSTYSRAVDTATGILDEMDSDKGPLLIEDERIREKEFGKYQNTPVNTVFDDLFAAVKEHNTKMIDFECEGGEKVADYNARIASFIEHLFEDIRRSNKPQTILIVSHGILMMRLMFMLQVWGTEPERHFTLKNWELKNIGRYLANTAYHVLSINAPKNETTTVVDCTRLNQDDHLAALPKAPSKSTKDLDYVGKTFGELINNQCTTQ